MKVSNHVTASYVVLLPIHCVDRSKEKEEGTSICLLIACHVFEKVDGCEDFQNKAGFQIFVFLWIIFFAFDEPV